jgi:UDP-N-acetyl-2-amino-2-deoxyglucuronate dehydrogenase
MNQSIHSIDLLQWLVGPIDTVFARTATLGHDIETEDTASALLAFRNGAVGVIQGATSCWPGDPARVELRGTTGTIIMEDGRITVWKLSDSTPEEESRMTSLEVQDGQTFADPGAMSHVQHLLQIEDMIDAIARDRQPRVTGLEARKAVEIIRAIYASAQRSQVICLPFDDEG